MKAKHFFAFFVVVIVFWFCIELENFSIGQNWVFKCFTFVVLGLISSDFCVATARYWRGGGRSVGHWTALKYAAAPFLLLLSNFVRDFSFVLVRYIWFFCFVSLFKYENQQEQQQKKEIFNLFFHFEYIYRTKQKKKCFYVDLKHA